MHPINLAIQKSYFFFISVYLHNTYIQSVQTQITYNTFSLSLEIILDARRRVEAIIEHISILYFLALALVIYTYFHTYIHAHNIYKCS
jgi:hypothetical protein